MSGSLCLSQQHVHRFAAASGDRNPLHVDEDFARATPYGRCIAHGALVTIAALAAADADALAHVQQLHLQFKQPVLPGHVYRVTSTSAGEGRTTIEVARAGRPVAAITLTFDPAAPPLAPAVHGSEIEAASSPRAHSLEQLAGMESPIREPYACRVDALAALAAELGAGGVPAALLSWLSAASYAVGMLIPGRDAVFAGARIARSAGDGGPTLTASVSSADDRTGLVVVEAAMLQGSASARMSLQTFARPAAPVPDRASIGRHLPPSDALAGRNVLVVGGSRGLGAALCGAFATQGANVWSAFARSRDRAEALRREFGADRVRLLQFDGGDADEARRAFADLRREAATLDGVVLCAAPALYETGLHPDASEATLRFVRASVAMTLVPLAEARLLLAADGWLALTSSSALDDPPEALPHEALAKAALEEAATYCARHAAARVLVVRPPRMWTDRTNTPLGRIGATATEEVAGAIVRWAANGQARDGVSLLTAKDLREPASGLAPGA